MPDQTDDNLFLWYEKTVEYKYILTNLTTKIRPFAGTVEKFLGDAIACTDGQYRLIEFKRNKQCRLTEWKKYPARTSEDDRLELMRGAYAFQDTGGIERIGHVLIYGGKADSVENECNNPQTNEIYPEFDLICNEYWSLNEDEPAHYGHPPAFTDLCVFSRYLAWLAGERQVRVVEEDGSSGLVELVRDGEVVHASVDEFMMSLKLVVSKIC